MSNKRDYADLTLKTIDAIRKLSDKLKVHPTEITRFQLVKQGGVSDYALRTLGGLDNLKARYFPTIEKDLPGQRVGAEVKSKMRSLEKKLAEKDLFEELVTGQLLNAVREVSTSKVTLPQIKRDKTKTRMTMEAMISDVHVGKKKKGFNFQVLRARLQEFTRVFLMEYEDNAKLFDVNEFIIAFLGDQIESFSMHHLESAIGCEFGNMQQVQGAIITFWEDVICPIGMLGVRTRIVGVSGNHDRTDSHRTFNDPGLNYVTHVIYQTLSMLCKERGFTNITWTVPESSFCILDVYGFNVLYEHGDKTKNSKDSFEKKMRERGEDQNCVVHMSRWGHWHTYQNYDRGRIIVNESVPGQDSFARELGFNSKSGQTINYYLETKTRPTSFYKSFPVCLGHIGG